MVWEDEKLMIHCPNSYYIQIVYAYYGFGVCRSSVAEEVVKTRYYRLKKYSIKFLTWIFSCLTCAHVSSLCLFLRCEGKMLCSMIVGSDTFEQPCPSLKKYLEVTYACVKGNKY